MILNNKIKSRSRERKTRMKGKIWTNLKGGEHISWRQCYKYKSQKGGCNSDVVIHNDSVTGTKWRDLGEQEMIVVHNCTQVVANVRTLAFTQSEQTRQGYVGCLLLMR
jgi:hypothetical protein